MGKQAFESTTDECEDTMGDWKHELKIQEEPSQLDIVFTKETNEVKDRIQEPPTAMKEVLW